MKQLENFIKQANVGNYTAIAYGNNERNWEIGDLDIYFDLASLTKVFTGLLVLKLVEEGKLNLSSPISNYLPTIYQCDIKQLLTHTSGLSDELIEFKPELIINWRENRGNKIVYSDINYIILYQVISTFGDFSVLMQQHITKDLPIVFNPQQSHFKCAPTEIRSDRGLVCGEVHDSKAFKLNGISGHAGLFASGHSLNLFFQRLINNQIIDLELIDSYLIDDGIQSRNLIFETKYNKQMGLFVDGCNLHTGFTGTSVLIDREWKNYIMICTNRIYPSRNNSAIFKFRQQVHNWYYQQIKGEKMQIIIVTHGRFGSELKESTEMIMGNQPLIQTVDFTTEDSLESLKEKIEVYLNSQQQIVILTDIKGGTPFNVSYMLSHDRNNIELGYGVNLPLLLTLVTQLNTNKLSLEDALAGAEPLIGKNKE